MASMASLIVTELDTTSSVIFFLRALWTYHLDQKVDK